MNLFRSEEHVGPQPGATIDGQTICDLGYAWYATRLAPDYRPRTPAESQAILESLGLTAPFWQL
jgi:hypothetical protein